MSVLRLVLYPDVKLKTRCDEVFIFDENLKTIINDMFDSMKSYKGIGLAANQVGIMKRIFVMDLTNFENATSMFDKKYCFINPEISQITQELSEYEEGCLSFPTQSILLKRFSKIKIKYQDIDGNFCENIADGIAATCIQHEFDHLNGIVMPERSSSIFAKNKMIEKAVKVKNKMEKWITLKKN